MCEKDESEIEHGWYVRDANSSKRLDMFGIEAEDKATESEGGIT